MFPKVADKDILMPPIHQFEMKLEKLLASWKWFTKLQIA